MRLPFLIHKSSKSSENFVQLPADRDTPASATGDAEQRQSLSLSSGGNAGRSRGLSAASNLSLASPSQQSPGHRHYARGRPVSMAFPSPTTGEMQMAQIEEELDTIMDEMGLQGEQRMTMKNMPVDSKVQLIHTHKIKQVKATDTTPLSEHLKILARAGTQSLPRARLEKLRVDISYQSVQQINGFIEEGGLRLLLTHLTQLNEKRTASRRVDELLKEHEILKCILGVAKVDMGARYLLEGSTAHLRHVMDSIGTMWLPCSVMSLRIVSYLVQQKGGSDSVLAVMFRRESANEESCKRKLVFVEWMDTIDQALVDYIPGALAPADKQSNAHIVDFVAATLMLINNVLDFVCASNIDRKVKMYNRLASHDMLAKFAGLRKWGLFIIDTHLNRWSEGLRRDYNIAKSQIRNNPSAVVLENGSDSQVRDIASFKGFVDQYELARAANQASSGSDNDDEYLQMNLSTYQTPAATHLQNKPATMHMPMPAASAPVTPNLGIRGANPDAADVQPAPSTNPFFSSETTRGIESQPELPFMPRSRSHSNQIAETGSLRDLRPRPSMPSDPASVVSGLKNISQMLKKSSSELPRLTSDGDVSDAYQEVQAIAQMAQEMLLSISGRCSS
ncbi:hypothetical protein H4R99_004796 [Coemansia sp. RSA 1722]|nr:hypothetical protein IWW45_007814 [Coemansia sp. RSA 485]KAJ2596753.1 hypothetical protein H4R99_004796 [Coemansia sp. RSA 1722]